MKEKYTQPEIEIVDLPGDVLTAGNSTEFVPDTQSWSGGSFIE